MENCDDELFLGLEDELWAKIYPEQDNAVEAQEGEHVEDNLAAADRGLPANDRDEGEELSAYFDNCDDGVMNIAVP